MKQIGYLFYFLCLMLFIQFLMINSTTNNLKTSVESSSNNSNNNNLNSRIGGKFLYQKSTFKTSQASNIDLDTNSGQTPLWKGWVKYFHLRQNQKFEEPSDFFVNNEYYKQKILISDKKSKGPINGEDDTPANNIFKNIPSKFNFFVNLNSQFLEINSNRFYPLTSKIESLNLDLIDPLSIDIVNTGLKEIGSFTEGSCIDLSVHALDVYTQSFMPTAGDYSSSSAEHWIFCLENQDDYTKFVGVLTEILVAKETARNRPEAAPAAKAKTDVTEEHYTGPGANSLLDGYLVRINDWTQCTLKCGGGFSYQQWKCIPNKDGGKPCKGDLIRKKPCNEQACPNISTSDGNENPSSIKNEAVTNDPIIKSQPISNRPQQNIECVIREEDVLQKYTDPNLGPISYPGRLILNSNLITLFTDIDEQKSAFSFDIKKATFAISSEACCFYLRNENKQYEICGMSNCSTFVNSWAYSFDLFAAKCYSGITSQPSERSSKSSNQSSSSSNGLSMTMEMDDNTASAKSQVINASLAKSSQSQTVTQLSATQAQSLKVINREIDIEEMIKKEEMIKSQEKVKNKIAEMKHEEKKKAKLDEALNNQQAQQSITIQQIKAQQSTQEIQHDTEDDILQRRNQLKLRIQKIRQQAERRTKLIQNKINVIRNKMTSQILEATKIGNQQLCKDSWGSADQMNTYCDSNYIDDILKNAECKDNDNFCIACCDSEFGLANVTGKNTCYSFCLSKESIRGDWFGANNK